MNISNIKIIILFLLIIFFGLYVGFTGEKKDFWRLKTFSFSYSTGYHMNASVSYSLKKDKEQEKYIAKIKEDEVAEKDAITFYVDDDFIEDLENLIKEYKLNNWDGFHKSDKNVLDGNGFSFIVNYENGKSISASGYEKYPKDYSQVENAISNLFYKKQKTTSSINLKPQNKE